jgi:hypothetical protein
LQSATPLSVLKTELNAFAAYIISFAPDDAVHRSLRLSNLLRQLYWWRTRTDLPVFLVASGWRDKDLQRHEEIRKLPDRHGSILRVPSQAIAQNRVDCLNHFYSSEFDWGIIMDDDAVLYDQDHNSGSKLFSEMAVNGAAAYDGVDVFFPINPAKMGFRKTWASKPELFGTNHVFKRNLDLKGSMFVVRNFRKQGRSVVLPNPNFHLHGEDTQFALESVAMGYSVMRCWNIVLEELEGESFFAEARKAAMKQGNEWLSEQYRGLGLKMQPDSHLLDKRAFLDQCWGHKRKTITVGKPPH